MVGRILRSADFVQVLAQTPWARSAHFAAHHLPQRPSLAKKPARAAEKTKLSTGDAPACPPLVDQWPATVLQGHWLGSVVPKRHAKRAVTRSLIKRQMRGLMQAQACALPAGLWVLRLRAAFDVRRYTSAASPALRQAARDELTLLLQRAAARG